MYYSKYFPAEPERAIFIEQSDKIDTRKYCQKHFYIEAETTKFIEESNKRDARMN